jgi:phosphatidylserine decarboxylase
VGAIFVSSIETVWHGVVTPPTIKGVREWQYSDNAPVLNKGDEMGRFNMGSTIIVLFENNKVAWDSDLKAGKAVKLRARLGNSL